MTPRPTPRPGPLQAVSRATLFLALAILAGCGKAAREEAVPPETFGRIVWLDRGFLSVADLGGKGEVVRIGGSHDLDGHLVRFGAGGPFAVAFRRFSGAAALFALEPFGRRDAALGAGADLFVRSVVPSPGGRFTAMVRGPDPLRAESRPARLDLVDLATGERHEIGRVPGPVDRLGGGRGGAAFSPDGRLLAVLADEPGAERLRRIAPAPPFESELLAEYPERASPFAVAAHGDRVAVARPVAAGRAETRIEFVGGEWPPLVLGKEELVLDLRFSPDGGALFVTSVHVDDSPRPASRARWGDSGFASPRKLGAIRRLGPAGSDLVVWNEAGRVAAPVFEAGGSAFVTLREGASDAAIVRVRPDGSGAETLVGDGVMGPSDNGPSLAVVENGREGSGPFYMYWRVVWRAPNEENVWHEGWQRAERVDLVLHDVQSGSLVTLAPRGLPARAFRGGTTEPRFSWDYSFPRGAAPR